MPLTKRPSTPMHRQTSRDREGAAEVELPVAKEASGIVLTFEARGPTRGEGKKCRDPSRYRSNLYQIRTGWRTQSLDRGWQNWGIGGWLQRHRSVYASQLRALKAIGTAATVPFSRSTPITRMPRQVFTAIVSLRPIALPTAVTNCFTAQK
jgi:hypothetical protein